VTREPGPRIGLPAAAAQAVPRPAAPAGSFGVGGMFKDYYLILGVDRRSSESQIKHAFRRSAC
jgi:hypothetical protein